MHLGEAISKCDHIAGTPLTPRIAERLHRIYLAKGASATTQIEGNTLTEGQVEQILDGELQLPESQEYLAQENENILDACQMILEELAEGQKLSITPERIHLFNKRILHNLPLSDEITPGEPRSSSVLVGSVYRGAPAEDVPYLLERMCRWLDDFSSIAGEMHRPVLIIRAILAHLYNAWIHPHGDGNGRTSRLVEFQLLLQAGVPTPACQLLSNYYNKTRSRYYEHLRRASMPPYPVEQFISYALRGFVEELREQLKYIKDQQIMVSWINYVHERLRGQSKPSHRQRNLLLSLPLDSATDISKLRRLTPEIAEGYAGKDQKTITRDINSLVDLDLVIKEGSTIRPNVSLIVAFMPLRGSE